MKVHVYSTLILGLMLAGGQVYAADQVKDRTQLQTQQEVQIQERDRIYGYDLMTPQERNAYQMKMRSLKTEQEREQFRKEHHEQMKVRAQQMGKVLPDEPPAMGAGKAQGQGMGAGGGMGRKRR